MTVDSCDVLVLSLQSINEGRAISTFERLQVLAMQRQTTAHKQGCFPAQRSQVLCCQVDGVKQ